MTKQKDSNNNKMNNNTETILPSVGPLYFLGKEPKENDLKVVPSEILAKCLVEYSNWGDLAKLANVQSDWKTILMDAASSKSSKWELAQALLNGTHGLDVHAELAVRLLHEVSGIDSTTLEPKSSTKCFAPAMKILAYCYFEGNGVSEPCQKMGVAWLKATYELAHDVDAAHELALIFEYGQYAVDIDVYAAAEWFGKAARGGHVEAMAEYAMCCELGCGREQSDEEALEWYIKAANAGHVFSNFSVGEAFEEARGVPQSDEEACLWYYKAAVEGDEDSKRALRRLRDIARIVVPGVGNLLDG